MLKSIYIKCPQNASNMLIKAITEPPTNPAPLVTINDTKPITTSRRVAEVFGKRHDNVLQAIQRLDCSEPFRLLNFKETTTHDEHGRMQPMVQMTCKGFSFLVMGFTGKKAALWKEQYIDAFDQMERVLLKRQNAEFLESRQQGKLMRRAETDEIKQFCTYAKQQGSSSPDRYYQLFTDMLYRELGLEAVNAPVLDNLSPVQAAILTMARDTVIREIRTGMADGLHYKTIFQQAKMAVVNLVAALPSTCLRIEGREAAA